MVLTQVSCIKFPGELQFLYRYYMENVFIWLWICIYVHPLLRFKLSWHLVISEQVDERR